MVKFPLKFFYNIGVISEILELPRFCPDFLQKKFYNIKPRGQCYKTFFYPDSGISRFPQKWGNFTKNGGI